MRFSALSVAFLSLSVGCSLNGGGASQNANAPSGGTSSGGSSSSGGEGAPVPTALDFEAVGDLVPRQEVTLHVRVRPAGVYQVRFALPDGVLPNKSKSAPLDAVLSATEVPTDENGMASIGLVSASSETTFSVRADVANAIDAYLPLSVKDTGFAEVQVVPRYGSALRYPTTWIATAHPGKTCADEPGIPPPDGSIVSSPAGQKEAPLLPQVPASTPLAITLRSGHFVGGCASLSPLAPDTKQTVTVPVLNRPIDLGASKLSLKLDIKPGDAAWSGLLGSAQQAVLGALPGTSIDDVDALLDAMREAAGDDRQLFESARQSEDWDSVVRKRLGSTASSKLRDLVAGWLTQAQKSFSASERLLEGTIEPDGAGDANAHLNLLSVAGVAPDRAGVASPALWSWSAGPDDNVTMGTDIYLFESKLLAALGEVVAVEARQTEDAPSALSQAVDCTGTGAALAAAGASPSLGYAGCDAACLESLCNVGLRAIWLRASGATALSPSRLTMTATGHAFVGEAAEVAGMNGSWLGELGDGHETTGGALTATTPP